MLISNGKIIIDSNGDQAALDQQIQTLSERAKEELARDVSFNFVAEPIPCYEIPTNLTFKELQSLGGGDITVKWKVIGDVPTAAPDTVTADIWHNFSSEEQSELGIQVSYKLNEIKDAEEQKKIQAKEAATHIKALESERDNISNRIRERGEYRAQRCKVIFDFKEGKKYFVNPDNDEVLKMEDIPADEYQLKFGFTTTVGSVIEEMEQGQVGNAVFELPPASEDEKDLEPEDVEFEEVLEHGEDQEDEETTDDGSEAEEG